MENENNEITISQLFYVLKKSITRGLLYLSISVIITTSILFTLRATTLKSTYKSTVSFLQADRNTATVMNTNKSNIINQALKEIYKDANTVFTISNKLESNIFILPQTFDNEDNDYIATSFEITIKPVKSLNLSKEEYKNILNHIVKNYVNFYALKSFPTLSLSFSLDENYTSTEYMQAVVELTDNSKVLLNTLRSYINNNENVKYFRSEESGKTLSDVIGGIEIIISNLDNLEFYITSNRIESIGNLYSYLEWLKQTATADVLKYTAILEAQENALDKYSQSFQGISTSAEGSYYFNNDVWNNILSSLPLSASNKAVAEYNLKIANDYLDAIENKPRCTDANKIATVKNQISNYYKSIGGILSEYRQLVNEYNSNMYLTSNVSVLKQAHSYTDSIVSTSLITILLVSVSFISLIISFIQTYHKIYPSNEIEK